MRVEDWNGHSIRFVEKDGEHWAVAKDVCEALGIENTKQALETMPAPYVCKTYIGVETGVKKNGDLAKQRVQVLILNELGIYRLIMRSNKPEAEAFQDWVFNIIKTIRRDVLKLKEYEAFRLMDKEHQKAAMKRLNDSLRSPVKVDYIKANTIADKAASTLHGFSKMVKKAAMDEGMLRDREAILNDTVELMAVNERFGLGLSVSDAVYRKHAPPKRTA